MLPLSLPLTLRLPDQTIEGDNEVTCLRALRIVKNRRSAYMAKWNGKNVFVKLFFDKIRAKQHWQREKHGIEVLTANGLLTAPLLYAGFLPDHKAHVLITEAIESARTMEQACNRVDSTEDGVAILSKAIEALATQHEAGILQGDIHLDNFLVAEEKIYSIDASRIRQQAGSIKKTASLENLGLFLGQFFPKFDRYVEQLFRHYAGIRQWQVTSDDFSLLQSYITKARQSRKKNFLRKIYRKNSMFACLYERGGNAVYNMEYSTEGFQKLFRDPASFFSDHEVRYLKRGNTATVAVANIDMKAVVVKRYNIKGLWHGIKRAFRRTRASISWENANLLRFYGIDTPAPMGFVENRVGPVRRTSYFISEYIDGPSCREYFKNKNISVYDKNRVASRIADMLSTLARFRISHGDMKATNFLVANDRVYLVDLDAMREYRTSMLFRRAYSRDIKRFFDNWANENDVRKMFEETIERIA